MKIAGVMQTKNYDDTFKVIQTLRELTDVVIVLDDNSTHPITTQMYPQIDVLLTRTHRGVFNCQRNHTLMMYLAWENKCDWIVRMDDDFILSAETRRRKSIENLIAFSKEKQGDIIRVTQRDLWNSYDTYRTDGIWGKKTIVLVQRVWFGDKNISLIDPNEYRLHRICFPENPNPKTVFYPNCVIYHTGCLTHQNREQRVENYKVWDRDHKFQEDYSYITDETGLTLSPVPGEDVFHP